jgi:hypothetical protein
MTDKHSTMAPGRRRVCSFEEVIIRTVIYLWGFLSTGHVSSHFYEGNDQ